MVLPIAHAGHWAIYALYAVPFIVVGFSIVTTTLRQRREGREAERDGP
jgi:uncharacterized membrane protein HdeD (DUF308 family)